MRKEAVLGCKHTPNGLHAGELLGSQDPGGLQAVRDPDIVAGMSHCLLCLSSLLLGNVSRE